MNIQSYIHTSYAMDTASSKFLVQQLQQLYIYKYIYIYTYIYIYIQLRGT
jgi:hypothetical protein